MQYFNCLRYGGRVGGWLIGCKENTYLALFTENTELEDGEEGAGGAVEGFELELLRVGEPIGSMRGELEQREAEGGGSGDELDALREHG